MPITIGFDADDTLWRNEHLYEEARVRYRAILHDSAAVTGHVVPDDLDETDHRNEVANNAEIRIRFAKIRHEHDGGGN